MTAEHGDVELVVDAAVAAGAAALGVLLRSVRRVAAVGEPVVEALLHPPLVPERYAPAAVLTPLAAQGRAERVGMEAAVAEAVRVAVPVVLDRVLDQVDLTKLVIDRVDIDAVVAHADVDAVVARADLDAILARIDLIDLAETIIDGVDLHGIIRDSTGSIASEGIRGVRLQTIDADERLNRLVDRVLLRRQARATAAVVQAESNGTGEER